MLPPLRHTPDPARDLVLERVVDIQPQQAFDAWTRPELITRWFTPVPWQTIAAEIDLRPGGIFKTVMRSPDGQEFPNAGCFLEVVEPYKLVWTGALQPGYRPLATDVAAGFPFIFSCVLTFEPHEGGTRYTALAIHPDEASCKKHSEMGFHVGWGLALDQLVAMVKGG